MNYYALFYEVVDGYVARRAPYRDDHLRLAQAAHDRGELLLAGALSDPSDRALLIFHAPDRSVVEDFVRRDPYVTNGLVTRWEIRSWAVVIGDQPNDPTASVVARTAAMLKGSQPALSPRDE
jgi:uncharacterized protein YciI